MLKRFTKRLSSYYQRIKRQIGWYKQYKRLCKRYSGIKGSAINYEFDKLLFIVPHADDELISSYQFLKSARGNIRLFYCGMTGENTEETNRMIRQKEFERLCHENHFEYVIVESIEQSLKKALIEYDPDAICLPSIVDWHIQHRIVNHIAGMVLSNMIKKPNIIWYQVTVPFHKTWANFSIPMNKPEQKEKWEMFHHIYRSQTVISAFRFQLNERLWGQMFGAYAAEVFCVMDFDRWRHFKNVLGERVEKSQMELKASINNLERVRNMATFLYEEPVGNKS